MAVSGKNLARWYREVSQHLRAGIPLPKALEAAGGVPARDRRRLAGHLREGESVEVALQRAPSWLPQVDRQVLASAAHSGQMVESLHVLAEKRAFASNQARKAAGAVAYPLFVLHMACLVLPIFVVGIGNWQAYGGMVLALLLPLWALIVLLVWAVRRRSTGLTSFLRLVPLLRGYLKNQSLAELCFTIRAYLAAGETIDVAWAEAGPACGDRRLARLGRRLSDRARLGYPPGDEIASARGLPEDFVSLYQTGEQTGQLEDNLHHLWRLYDERAGENLRAATFWYPMLLLMAVAVFVGYIVITAYASYLEGLMDVM